MGALRKLGIAGVLAAVLAAALLVAAAQARPPCTIEGTPERDRLIGTPGRDVICGGDGRDVIRGAGGNDILRGGGHADILIGGPGNDILRGQRGADRMWGGAGPDRLFGTEGNDRFYAYDGWRDWLVGGAGRDSGLGDRKDVRRGLESFSVPVPAKPRIAAGPQAERVSNSRSARFVFSSDSPVKFECSLDSAPRKSCGTGRRGAASYQGLPDGGHVFSVRAVDWAGSASSPARRAWRIDATPPRAEITGAPGNGTSRTATFRYRSSEPGRFLCNLDSTGFRPCGAGTSGSRTYSGLSLGAHLFEVRAVDSADNVGAPDSHRWTIASPPSPSDPVIAAAGDIACDPAHPNFNGGNGRNGDCRQLAVSNLLVGKGYDAVLLLGDNQYYCGSYAAWLASYDRSWGRVKGITRPSAGNHEYITQPGSLPSTGCDATNAGAAGYFRYFGSAAGDPNKGYYSYDVGAWHLIALNSNCGDAGGCGATSTQTRWLRADLNAHRTRCTLAYWHVPLYSSGGRDEAKTRPFWQALYDANAELVLTGHDHTYERFAPQNPNGGVDRTRGIREFVVGTGGANHTSFVTVAPNSEVRNADTYGVLELKLHPGSYEWRFVPEQGRSFSDSGTNACH